MQLLRVTLNQRVEGAVNSGNLRERVLLNKNHKSQPPLFELLFFKPAGEFWKAYASSSDDRWLALESCRLSGYFSHLGPAPNLKRYSRGLTANTSIHPIVQQPVSSHRQ